MGEIEKVMDRVKKMLALGNCEGATEELEVRNEI